MSIFMVSNIVKDRFKIWISYISFLFFFVESQTHIHTPILQKNKVWKNAPNQSKRKKGQSFLLFFFVLYAPTKKKSKFSLKLLFFCYIHSIIWLTLLEHTFIRVTHFLYKFMDIIIIVIIITIVLSTSKIPTMH